MFCCNRKHRIAVFFACFMSVAGAFGLLVLIGSLTRDWGAGEQERFEGIDRVIGCALILAGYPPSPA